MFISCVKIYERQPLHCRNYNQDTDEEDDEEESEEEESEEDEEDEEENDYKAMGHSCEYELKDGDEYDQMFLCLQVAIYILCAHTNGVFVPCVKF